MLLLKGANLAFPGFAFLGASQSFFLPADHPVCTVQKSLYFTLVGVLNGDLHRAILLVFAVQMEDHLGQLGDLL